MADEMHDAEGGHRPEVSRKPRRSIPRCADGCRIDEKVYEVEEAPSCITRPEHIAQHGLECRRLKRGSRPNVLALPESIVGLPRFAVVVVETMHEDHHLVAREGTVQAFLTDFWQEI